MKFLITPGYANQCQFFIWLRDKHICNKIADKIETSGKIEISETRMSGRWVNPNMPEAGCLVAWHTGENLSPQQMYNEVKWATQAALNAYYNG